MNDTTIQFLGVLTLVALLVIFGHPGWAIIVLVMFVL